MNKFYPYWRFFAENKFPQGTDLKFFNDGGFAITVNNVVSLYSNIAVLIARYENAFALENGCICERYHENLIIHYKDAQYPIPCPSGIEIRSFRNAVSLTVSTITNEQRLYFITPEYKDLRYIVLKDCTSVDNTSPNGKAVLCTSSRHKLLVDRNGETINVGGDFIRVDFLDKGCYIVHYTDDLLGSALYNNENECVLVSYRNYGILPLGNRVNYENALIANLNGHFVAEYQQQTAVFDFISIYPYYINHTEMSKRFFWPGGKMMCFRGTYIGTVLCYWHAGHFYFAPPYVKKKYIDIIEFDKPSRRYLQRIQEII